MAFSILLMMLSAFWQSEVPYKPNDEFQLDVDFKLKSRPAPSSGTYDFGDTRAKREKEEHGGGQLPYLILHFKILKLAPEEVRIRAVNGVGLTVVSKKAELGKPFKMDLGFTNDIKDRVTPHEYFVYFLDTKKKEISRIHLFVHEDGSFMVNNEKRGRF